MTETQVLVIHVRGQEERKTFVLHQLETVGLPYHFILDGNGAILSGPRGYNLDIRAFVEFLDQGKY